MAQLEFLLGSDFWLFFPSLAEMTRPDAWTRVVGLDNAGVGLAVKGQASSTEPKTASFANVLLPFPETGGCITRPGLSRPKPRETRAAHQLGN